MATGSPAHIAAANAGVGTGNANATRKSNRLAGRPATIESLPPTARITKKPRKQPSRRNELNTNRIARAVEEEQRPQPAGENTPSAEESVSEQRSQPAGEGTAPAEASASGSRLSTASETATPAEVSVNEQRLQTAYECTSSAEVFVDANNGVAFYHGERASETSADGNFHYPTRRYDEELRHSYQPMSDSHDDGGDQGGYQGGRGTGTSTDGSVHSPTRRYDEESRSPDSQSQYRRLHWYEDGERVEVLIDRRIRVRGRYLSRIRGHYGESDDEDMEQGPEEPDGDPDGLDADPAPPYENHAEGPFLQVLFASVTTQRALRRKLKELRKCQQNIQDANLVARSYETALRQIEPTTDGEWSIFRATEANILVWETKASEKRDLETRISLQVEFLEDRAHEEARSSQQFSPDFSRLSREGHQLGFLSRDDGFWEIFDKYQAACQSLAKITADLRHFNEYKNSVNDAIKRGCKQDFNRASYDFTMFSILTEKMIFGDLSRISDALDKHNKLQDSKLAAEKLQTEHWMQLLTHAETAFVGVGVLEMAAEGRDDAP